MQRSRVKARLSILRIRRRRGPMSDHWPSVFLKNNVNTPSSRIHISLMRTPDAKRSLIDFLIIRSESEHFSMIIRSD